MDDSHRPATSTSRLSVLFIGGFDSTNYVYVELVREFEARGHRCTVVVEDPDDAVNNKMFPAAGIVMTPLSAFSAGDLADVDVAFSGQFIRPAQRDLFDAIARGGVLLISFANLFSAVTQWAPADLVITSGESKFGEFADSGLAYRMVAIGNPQYDSLARGRERWQATRAAGIRKVLVVDQGAYPLGAQGKSQLAECLKGIAANNPGLVFHIKPRYLPDEEGEHLHKLSDHLYHYLRDVPENLVLIREPTVLEELVLEYDAMITTWSTAHLDAAVLGMPLMLIGGLDSVDVFDVRLQRVDRAYARLQETGCVVDWREAQATGGSFAQVSPAYLHREFYDAGTPCAPKVVDLVEAIDRSVLAKGRTFAGGFALGYDEFVAALGASIETRELGSNADRLNRKLFRETNAIAQEFALLDRSMGYVFDMSEILPFWAERLGEDSTQGDIETTIRELDSSIASMKERFFRSHEDEIASDMFIQDAYFDWLYSTGRRNELFAYSGPLVAPESLEFNKGMARLKSWRLFSAAAHFVESFSISLGKPVLELRKNKNIATLLAQTDRSLPAHAVLFFLNAASRFDALASVDAPERPGFEAVVYYRLKALVALGRGEEARALHDRYLAASQVERHRPAGRVAAGALLRSVIGWYRFRLRGYARRVG
jgi:hypothetical protein